MRRRFMSPSNIGEINIDNYLTIEALEDDFEVTFSNDCEYCIDGSGDWRNISTMGAIPHVNKGQLLSFRANLTPNYNDGIGRFGTNGRFNLRGNCTSMLFGDSAHERYNDISSKAHAFRRLFESTRVVRVSMNFLPSTILSLNCYDSMFYGCSSLIEAPELPATTLFISCYTSMFYGCSSLKIPPKLPAKELSESCYDSMFYNCSSLIEAPELPATTLRDSCYFHMFRGCTSLTSTPDLSHAKVVSSCYRGMFRGCSKLVTVTELPSINVSEYAYSGMFQECTKITTPPELPATRIEQYAYSSMFYGCTGLTSAPKLPATTLADWCYYQMFYGCTSLTTAPVLPATKLANRCYQTMFRGCSKLNYIAALFTTIPSESYTHQWVQGVASSGTFVKNKNATWNVTGEYGIPSGWTIKYDAGFTPTKCTSLTITADNVSGRATKTTIHYTAIVDGTPLDGSVATGVEITGTAESEYFPQNTSETEEVIRTISYTYMGVTATTTIIQGVWTNQYYAVDLNDSWELSTDISNPDSSTYEGVYVSHINKGVHNKAAIMYIDITGYTNFSLYIRSYAESNYDYVMVSQLDQTIDNNTSYSNSTLVKAHTRGNQQSGTAISNYTLVTFSNIGGDTHRITVLYRKDSSASSGLDEGYLLIPKNQ